MAISNYYLHLVVKYWQLHTATDIVLDKNGNFTLLKTPTGHEWQFHIATDI